MALFTLPPISNNEQLIAHLKMAGVLKSKAIEEALRANPREEFVQPEDKDIAYADAALPIGFNQTISQPYTVVFMLEQLKTQKGDKVMDIGAGSGWQTALLASIVEDKGQVVAYEIVPEVAEFGLKNLSKFNYQNVKYLSEDYEKSYQEFAPFQRIIAGAGFIEIPKELIQSLVIGGCLVAPTQSNEIEVIKRQSEDQFEYQVIPGFVFVPITHQS